MKHVVNFSGGIGSWMAAKRVAEKFGTEDMTLLFADTLIEDEDLYRFIEEAADDIGVALTRIAEGRDPWQVYFDERFLGNSRIDPCSKKLKREICDKWLEDNCVRDETIVYVGIDWSEVHRFDNGEGKGIRPRKLEQGWVFEAPLCDAPYLLKSDMKDALKEAGIRLPRLYEKGFSHNNCGGFCCKAGKGHFANLLKTMPERYRYHENKEQEFRAFIGKDVSMLTDVVNEVKVPLTLLQLRERIEAGGQVDMFDIGGCGCFIDEEITLV